MRVLLLGSNGMLGLSLKKFFQQKHDVQLITGARTGADFCFDFCNDVALENCIKSSACDIVINASAIVNLSLCESDILNSYLVNARLVSVLSDICKKGDIYFVHISTDHYYSGDKNKKHSENDKLVFLNEYARSKFCGEQFALQYEKSLVVRTNIVGFKGNVEQPTFLEWAIASLKSDDKINVFSDFYTSSIHTLQFASILYDLICLNATGLFNVASSEVFSKKEFILSLSQSLFNCVPLYMEKSVKSLECKRAESLGLDCSKAERLLGYKMPNLHSVIESIKKEYDHL